MINARSLAKRLLPSPYLRKHAKVVWESIKISNDRKNFRKFNADTPYIIFSAAQLAEIKAQGYCGQIVQDYFLDVLFDKSDGMFLDIGANNPFKISNTLFFEKKGWKGYAFDPIKSLKELWKQRPNTTFINAAISENYEQKPFIEIVPKNGWGQGLSGFAEFVRKEDLRDFDYNEYVVECAPLSHFIEDDIRFDFVSIDVEGAEGLILKGLGLERSAPLAIVIENNRQMGGSEEYRRFLFDRGYRLVARINASDDLFVHADHDIPARFQTVLAASV